MSLSKYFKFPFALAGDKAAIPDATQPSGDVSFQEGYGLDYQLDPATEPSAKNIERDKANQLYYDITQAIKEYQEFGIPYWIEPAQNGGVSFPYAKFALVRYDIGGGETPIFQSLVDNNTALPTVTANWQRLASANPFIIDNATFEASVANGEIVYWDNANNRFDEALADGTALQNAVGIADVSNLKVYLFGSIPTGLLSGLSANVPYYLSPVTPGGITSVRPTSNAVQIGISKSATTFFLNITPAQSDVGVTPPQFDNDTSLATTAFVQRALGNRQNFIAYDTTPQTLNASQAGSVIYYFGGTSGNFTLPDIATIAVGGTLSFCHGGTGTLTLTCFGAQTINGINAAPVSSISFGQGDTVELVKSSGGTWVAYNGTPTFKNSAAFASLLTASGYQKLPSGLIIQWGEQTAGAGGTLTVILPVAYTTANLQSYATSGSANLAATAMVSTSNLTQTGFAAINVGDGGVGEATLIRWFSIGY